MQNNYDPIANYYDVLSRMVYGHAQVKAQIEQLSFIPANSNVLIVGGGTGWILEEIAKIHPAGLQITYVEISEKMLALSKKRNSGQNQVSFIHSSAENFQPQQVYDVILTAFLFDNFGAVTLPLVFDLLDGALRKGGRWLFVDFYYSKETGKRWQGYLLKTMYLFFKYISSVEASELISTAQYFDAHNYRQLSTRTYYAGFIKSIIYDKS